MVGVRLVSFIIIFATTFLLTLLTPGDSRAEPLEYLYVNANVGAAAGGHSAVKLGEDVFHYQFFPDERFLLVRESWDHFRLIYNSLLNRTIFSASIPLSEETARTLRSGFTTTLATQQSDLYQERMLQDRMALLNGLAVEGGSLEVRGWGFYDDQQRESDFGQRLREFIKQSRGGEFLFSQKVQTGQRIEFLFQALNENTVQPGKIMMFLDELYGLLKKQAVLDVLLNGSGLSPMALLGAKEQSRLNSRQLEILSALLLSKMQTVASLLGSSRSDSGEALLLEIARCHAIHSSIREKVLFSLDPFPDNGPTKMINFSDPGVMSYLQDLKRILRDKTEQLVDQLNPSAVTKSSLLYTIIENVNGRFAELSSALASGSPVRLASEYMVPSRKGSVALNNPSPASPVIAAARLLLTEQQVQHTAKIKQSYSYHLITRNCVNDLQRTVNNSFSGQQESEQLLGGWIDPAADRLVIPYDYFNKIKTRYRVEQVNVYPARRLADLAAHFSGESGPGLWFREGNSITSTLYQPRTEDTPFLFFTDDLVWARPPLGLINLAWAALHVIGGVFYLPTDGSEQLWQGLRGMFYSLPELIFFNIRKGTYGYEDLSTRTKTL